MSPTDGNREQTGVPDWQVQIPHELVDTPEEGNADVVVTLKSGERYAATFFTLDNIRYLFSKFAESGECLNGLYFWATGMIVVERLDRWTIERTVEGLLSEEALPKAFQRLDSAEETG